jgi:hypothetical protein
VVTLLADAWTKYLASIAYLPAYTVQAMDAAVRGLAIGDKARVEVGIHSDVYNDMR